MARRYSDTELAAIWAMRCQQGEDPSPIAIRRALARDDLGLGYEIHGPNGEELLPKRTMQDILQRLERKHGAPVASVKPGEEDDAIDAIRREGLAAIRAEVRRLSAKQAAGTITPNEMRTLDVAVKSAESARERERRRRTREKGHDKGRDMAEQRDSGTATLTKRLVQLLEDGPVPSDAEDSAAEGDNADLRIGSESEEVDELRGGEDSPPEIGSDTYEVDEG